LNATQNSTFILNLSTGDTNTTVNYSVNKGDNITLWYGTTNGSTPLNLSEGVNNITIDIFNNTNGTNDSSSYLNITVDTTPPAIIINDTNVTNPTQGDHVNFTVNVTDLYLSYDRIDSAWLVIDGGVRETKQISNNANNVSMLIITNNSMVGAGVGVKVAVFVNDTAGNWNTTGNVTINVTDGTAPNVTIITVNGTNYTTGTARFSFNATDNWGLNLTCNISVNGFLNETNATSFYHITSVLSQNLTIEGFDNGKHTWNVSCRDNQSNIGTSIMQTLFVDTTSPTFEINWTNVTVARRGVHDDPINVTVAVNDSFNKIDRAILFVDSVENQSQYINLSNNSRINITFVTTVDGDIGDEINLTVKVNDSLGNWNQTSFFITVRDGNPPAMVGIRPADSTKNITNNSIKFSFNISANYTSVGNCTLNLSSKDNQTININVTGAGIDIVSSFGHVNLSDGFHGWNIICNDSFSNFNTTATQNITVDVNSPKILTTVIDKPAYFNSTQTALVTVEANDTGTGISNITVDGTALTVSVDNNTINLTVYNGTLTFGDIGSEGINNLSITATDTGGKANTSTTLQYYLDTTYPLMTVHSPNATTNITNADGNVSFSWTVVERNLSNTSVSIDNGSVVLSNLTVVNGTITLSANATTNLTSGTHTAVFTTTDWANLTVTQTVTFTVIANVDTSEAMLIIKNTSGTGTVDNVSIINATGGNSLTGVLNLNNTVLGLRIDLNNSFQVLDVNMSVIVPNFSASDANWNQSDFVVNVMVNSTEASTISSNLGANLSFMAVISNFSQFLEDDKYSARIQINTSLINRTPVFFSGSSLVASNLIRLSQCTDNTTPSSVTTVAAACYTEWTNNITFHLPHFDGVGLANDTIAPTINILEPSNTSILSDTVAPLRFEALELNPNGTFCIVNVTNSTAAVQNLRITNGSANWSVVTGTNYTYVGNLSGLTNTQYNLTIYCADLNNRTTTIFHHNFTVSDVTAPTLQDITVATDSITTEGATVTWTTDETSNSSFETCEGSYSNSSSYVTSHSIIITGGLAADTQYGVNITSCDYYSNCGNDTVNFTTVAEDSDSSGGSSSSGGGGGGAAIDPGTLSAMINQRKAWYWSVVNPGVPKTITVKEADFPVKQASFTTVRKVSGVTFSAATLKGLPEGINALQGDVYQYLYLSTKNMDNDAISSASVSFSVPKTWTAENSVDQDSITLYRYVEPSWTTLDTVFDKQDTTSLYFTATSPGFSYFAVGGEAETASMIPTEPEPEVTGADVAAAEDARKDTQKPGTTPVTKEKPDNTLKYVVYIVIVVLVALLIRSITKKPEKTKKK